MTSSKQRILHDIQSIKEKQGIKRNIVVWFKARGEPEPRHNPHDIFIEFSRIEEKFL